MNVDDFKKLLEEALDSIKKDLQAVKKTQNEHTGLLEKHSELLERHTEILEEHTDLLEKRILPPLTEIETTVKSYKDSYQINKANIERLDDRLSKFEDDAGVIVPPELAIQR